MPIVFKIKNKSKKYVNCLNFFFFEKQLFELFFFEKQLF